MGDVIYIFHINDIKDVIYSEAVNDSFLKVPITPEPPYGGFWGNRDFLKKILISCH